MASPGSRRIAPRLSGALRFKLLHCNCGLRPNSKFMNFKNFIRGVHSSSSNRRGEQLNLRALEFPVHMGNGSLELNVFDNRHGKVTEV